MDPALIYQQTTRHFLKPVAALLDDPDVTEVMINGPDHVYAEKQGRVEKTECRFPSLAALRAAANNMAEYVDRPLDSHHHSLDGRLPDGSRIHIVIPPASRQGVCITIRKFKKAMFDLGALVELGSLSSAAKELIEICVALHKNVVISGGTGTGKTSMLNAASASIAPHERIIVIEDSSELRLKQPHTLYLEAQPASPDGRPAVTIRDLFVDSLRMRPDRIIVGEVRRGEALDLIQSMISGHAGSLTTVHANTPRDALVRLETLCLMSDVSLPVYVARAQVASAVHVIVQIARYPDGSRRVQRISEQVGLDDQQNYKVRDILRFESKGRDADGRIQGQMAWTRRQPSFRHEVLEMGVTDMVKICKPLFFDDHHPSAPKSATSAKSEAPDASSSPTPPPEKPSASPPAKPSQDPGPSSIYDTTE